MGSLGVSKSPRGRERGKERKRVWGGGGEIEREGWRDERKKRRNRSVIERLWNCATVTLDMLSYRSRQRFRQTEEE